jgi:hypothetical protein
MVELPQEDTMCKSSVPLVREERPRLALRLGRLCLGREYDEDTLAAEIIVSLYSVPTALVAVMATAVGYFVLPLVGDVIGGMQ